MSSVPSHFPEWQLAAHSVISTGQRAYQRGWLPATSGNLSVRAQDGLVAITRSGADKGALQIEDILPQPVDAALLPGSSAEAALHLQLYRDRDDVGAVFHTHGLAAAVLGRVYQQQAVITLRGWELQKALRGVRTHEARVLLPVFANTQDIGGLSHEVSAFFAHAPAGALLAPGYVIAGHGLYAWGASAQEAWRHLEALDVLLNAELSYASAASFPS